MMLADRVLRRPVILISTILGGRALIPLPPLNGRGSDERRGAPS